MISQYVRNWLGSITAKGQHHRSNSFIIIISQLKKTPKIRSSFAINPSDTFMLKAICAWMYYFLHYENRTSPHCRVEYPDRQISLDIYLPANFFIFSAKSSRGFILKNYLERSSLANAVWLFHIHRWWCLKGELQRKILLKCFSRYLMTYWSFYFIQWMQDGNNFWPLNST